MGKSKWLWLTGAVLVASGILIGAKIAINRRREHLLP